MSSKLLILLVGALSLLGAGSNSPNDAWQFHDTFVLKKDQTQHLDIHAAHKDHKLAFGWTLYAGGGLVMHVTYDGRAFEPMLYQDFRRNTFRIDLFAKPNDASAMQYETPHALLIFTAFDDARKEAWLDVKIKSDETVEVYYTKGK